MEPLYRNRTELHSGIFREVQQRWIYRKVLRLKGFAVKIYDEVPEARLQKLETQLEAGTDHRKRRRSCAVKVSQQEYDLATLAVQNDQKAIWIFYGSTLPKLNSGRRMMAYWVSKDPVWALMFLQLRPSQPYHPVRRHETHFKHSEKYSHLIRKGQIHFQAGWQWTRPNMPPWSLPEQASIPIQKPACKELLFATARPVSRAIMFRLSGHFGLQSAGMNLSQVKPLSHRRATNKLL